METEIKLGHTVMIDDCIADEIKELNNKYNIQTIDTCCGHLITLILIGREEEHVIWNMLSLQITEGKHR